MGPAVHTVAAPAVTYAGYALPAVKPVEVKVEKVEPVEIKAPVVTYAAAPALAHPVHYTAPVAAVHHAVVHQPVATHTYTNTLPHVLGAGAPILGGLPVVAAAKPAD